LKSYKRNLVIQLIEKGSDNLLIAELTEFSESWVRQLRRVYKKNGAAGLILEKPGGSKCRLSDANLEHLRTVLGKGAPEYGLEGEFWDRKRVKYVIEQEFGVIYDEEHISVILAKINYTLQKPRKKDFRQNDEKVIEWQQETLPEIKKKVAQDPENILLTSDEAGFNLLSSTQRTYAPCGQTPVIQQDCKYTHLSVIAAISPCGEMVTEIREEAFNGEAIVKFLRLLLILFKKDIHLIWDGAKIHANELVKTFLSTEPEAKRLFLYRMNKWGII
jgi:transposase